MTLTPTPDWDTITGWCRHAAGILHDKGPAGWEEWVRIAPNLPEGVPFIWQARIWDLVSAARDANLDAAVAFPYSAAFMSGE